MTKHCLMCRQEFSKKVSCSLKSWSGTKYCSQTCYWESKEGRPSNRKNFLHTDATKEKIRLASKQQWQDGRGVGNFKKGRTLCLPCHRKTPTYSKGVYKFTVARYHEILA